MEEVSLDRTAAVLLHDQLLFSNFNSDGSCICIGTKHNFSIFNTNPIIKRYSNAFQGGIRVASLYYCSSLVCVVPSGDLPGTSPRKLILYNCTSEEKLTEITYPSTIRNCQMNKTHMIVTLDEDLYVYNLRTLSLIKTTKIANSNGLFSICYGSVSILAFPKHGATDGFVSVYEINQSDWRPMCDISAHKNSINAMHISLSGSLLATSSATGTVIRVFQLPSGNKLCSFRRGHKPVEIGSLNFCSKENYLAVVSSSGTVHIFCLADAIGVADNNLNHMRTVQPNEGYVNSFLSSVVKFAATSSLVPNSLKDIEEVRALYIATIPSFEGRCKASLVYTGSEARNPTVPTGTDFNSSLHDDSVAESQQLPKLYLVTDGGYFFRFNLPYVNRESRQDSNLSLGSVLRGDHVECVLEEESQLIEL